ncbi:Uncharacterised protein [Sphingobacterium mizutaii]|uniref:Uncharacterized protein n=1 Tax=Sphingobacterium mizutaii TaxID=1010 RepID=A0AAJ5C222_9SPHI|nr:hypothetical protein SAMN05192578_104233 [Sphingobacterium mizutaii]SNV62366.1 Uncharacterised protein [Sphingobacterium mizutaii]
MVNSAHSTCPAGKSWCAEIQVTGGRTCTDFPNAVWSTFPPARILMAPSGAHIRRGHHEHPLNRGTGQLGKSEPGGKST